MIMTIRSLKVLADENRLRLLMLLRERELFVCQIMAIAGISQPLVSRNLALLERAGLLDSRRDGKQVFYSLKKDLPSPVAGLVEAAAVATRSESVFAGDRDNLTLFCRRFQRGAACGMGTVRAFIAFKNKNQGANYGKTGQKSVH
jgi:DNA-binding transcriptional ArsR family regulator